MEQSLPYLVTPGSIKTALERIRQAATPERVTGDFMSAKLNMKGGTGRALIPFLKKIGLVASDGAPTELYRRFRNPAVGSRAIADAIKLGYRRLGELNEYFFELKDSELLALINQATGAEATSSVSKLTLSTFKNLKAFANFDATDEPVQSVAAPQDSPAPREAQLVRAPLPPESLDQDPRLRAASLGLNLSYTINLNLPTSSDPAVFNAIFKSLKEHLLVDPD